MGFFNTKLKEEKTFYITVYGGSLEELDSYVGIAESELKSKLEELKQKVISNAAVEYEGRIVFYGNVESIVWEEK